MTSTGRSPWLLCRRRHPDARLRLYCFPHSGGSPGEYLRWSDGLPAVELWGVQLPARGGRLNEPALTSLPSLVDALLDGATFEPPFAFFGHSFGGLLAYRTALALRARGRPGPRHLVVSGFAAPHLYRPGPPLHLLPDDELAPAAAREFGALPPEVLTDPELRALALTPLRADLAVLAGYRYAPAAPLDVPLDVLAGDHDLVAPAALAGWREYTTAAFELRTFPGDHFYFRNGLEPVLAHLAGRLAAVPDR